MYHLSLLGRGTTFELGNPDTTLARKAKDWVSSPTCRNLDLPFSRGTSKQTTTAPHPGRTHTMGACSARRGMIVVTRSPAARESLDYCSGYLLCRFLEITDWQGLACPGSSILSRHFDN